MRNIILFFVLLFLQGLSSSAQEVFIDGAFGTTIQAGTNLTVEDQYQQCRVATNCPYDFELESTRLYTKLYFDESLRNYYATDWKVTIDYSIAFYQNYSSTSSTNTSHTLEIDYHPTENYKDIDAFIHSLPAGFYTKADVAINTVTITDRNGSPTTVMTTLPDYIHFDVHLEVNRVYTLDVNRKPRVNTFNSTTGINTVNNTFTISWDFLSGAHEYDVEWLFVNMGNSPQTDEFYLDFKNATRVTTQQHFYDISLAYPRGFIIWRVRGVGLEKSDPASLVFDKRVEGVWSFNSKGYYKQNGVDLVPTSGNTSGNSRYSNHNFFWPGLEQDKNWQYNVVYAEDGKRKEVINFYDDILKPEQTVTILNTDQTAVVAQPVYDFVGRNSLQVLPAPQESQGMRHYDALHKDNSGNNYYYPHFDTDNLVNMPKPLGSQSNKGAGYYYSDQNTNPIGINGQYTPDAKGYPFSRTIYKNDGSGRVKAVSGVGKEYFSNGGQLTHETKFLYGSPFQEELTMLFGNNVGFAKYYEKTVAIDANGQASASVKDLSGRVIMTSLVGEAPENLKNIDTKPTNPITLNVNLNRLNTLTDDALTVNKVLLATGSTMYNFQYSLTPELFNNCGVDTSCVYDLEIYLKDDYGQKQPIVFSGATVSEISLTKVTDVASISFSAQVAVGSYQLIKKLTLNEAHLNDAVQDWIDSQMCYEPRKIDPIESCNPNCEELCKESYWSVPDATTGIHYYLALDDGRHVAELNNGSLVTIIDQTAYNAVLAEIATCQAACEAYDPTEPPLSDCEFQYELLKQDMSPGGQYFDNIAERDDARGNANSSYDKNGWLKNNADQTVKTCLQEKMGIRQYATNTDDFWNEVRDNWQDEYVDITIKMHPEWCAFEKLCGASWSCSWNDLGVNSTFNMDPTAAFVTDQATIDGYLSKTDWGSISAQAKLEAPASLHSELEPSKLKERGQKFYEELLKYRHVKQQCSGLHLQSPAEDALTAEGFAIRYPYNEIFEDFDPDDPEAYQDKLEEENCKRAADQVADQFVQRLKNNCDVLTSRQEQELWQFIHDTYLKDCQDPSTTVNLNDAIRDYISCTSMLPEGCFVDALPEQTEESCECKNINDFVVGVIQSVTPTKTYLDIVSDVRFGSNQEVQDALEAVLYPDDLSLKGDFAAWYKECNTAPHYSWTGGGPKPPAVLAAYFSCEDEEEPEDPIDTDKECAEVFNAMAQAVANLEFEQLMRQKAAEYKQAYVSHCLAKAYNGNEQFTLDYLYNEYHYTLYYYDQAGDLVATVPPEGVYQQDALDATRVVHDSRITDQTTLDAANRYLENPDTNPFVNTKHLMITNYRYNSLQNVVRQNTPDGNDSHFYYDALGRLVVSQNAEQVARDAYSYLSYDLLGRTIEAGELISTTAMNKAIAEDITDYNNPTGANALLNWLDGKKRNERTLTFYDQVNPSITGPSHPAFEQQNFLRNRIGAVVYDQEGDSYDAAPGATNRERPVGYDALTHYDYDVLGNVETLWQENRAIPITAHQVKRFDYTYDLVSGNVNTVSYQKEKQDQMLYRYRYDADNRLTEAHSSTNGLLWDTDARYFYYAHGPLAREEIGDKHVFANDMIYDIRGWITAQNSSMTVADRDAGKDGVAGELNENFGRDPFAYSLHYFKDHYQPISTVVSGVLASDFSSINSTAFITTADTKPLYNGNISMMVTSMKDITQQPINVMANAYTYDQLNRIKSYKPFWDTTSGNNPLARNDFANVSNNGDYNSSYVFDGNGNIEQLYRNGVGASQAMDKLSYNYNYNAVGAKINNQLFHVDDPVGKVGNDLDDQNAGNYVYDNIGRLVTDVSENISMNWNVSNKVRSITRPAGIDAADLEFRYGPMGNRIYKTVVEKDALGNPQPPKSTWYVLDASGNPIAFYELENGVLTLKDFVLYGNKRLGTFTQDKTMQ